MDPQEKEQIAQEKYGKSFSELTTNEQKAVGGVYGGHSNKSADDRSGEEQQTESKEGSAQQETGGDQ